MKYYDLHEDFWQQLVNKGHISWDRESKTELMINERNIKLKKIIKNQNKGSVLDLGCGSGSQSFYLSNLGFDCTAVDVSKTAIAMGK